MKMYIVTRSSLIDLTVTETLSDIIAYIGTWYSDYGKIFWSMGETVGEL